MCCTAFFLVSGCLYHLARLLSQTSCKLTWAVPDRLSHLTDCNCIIRMLFHQAYWYEFVCLWLYVCVYFSFLYDYGLWPVVIKRMYHVSVEDFTDSPMQSKAMVTHEGVVFWPPPVKLRSSCKVDITYFPFDDQKCELKFGSWTYDGFQVCQSRDKRACVQRQDIKFEKTTNTRPV